VNDLGRMPYARALAVQREVNLAVSQGRYPGTAGANLPGTNFPGADLSGANLPGADLPGVDLPGAGAGCLLLVEHDPVVTVTHRQGTWDNLLATPDRLKELGIDVQVTDRGGDITYHGPGQLVAYPILQLKPLGLNLGSYMWLLEQVVIDVLSEFGIPGQRDDGAIGVWVRVGDQGSGVGDRRSDQTPDPRPQTQLAKVCSMGVRVRKNTTMHGLALNVTTDLSHFKTIDPCGLGGRPVTSLAELLGDAVPTMDEVKAVLVKRMQTAVDSLSSGAVR
jgi:lipoyl(octanoyl) transferase